MSVVTPSSVWGGISTLWSANFSLRAGFPFCFDRGTSAATPTPPIIFTGCRTTTSAYPQTIHHVEPFSLEQVVWVTLDCPYKGSAKQLCISFFAEMDKILHTNFEALHGSSRLSVDEMVVHMAEIADRHAVGVLVIDEIQHLLQAPGTGCNDLLNFLVTLANKIGIPVMIIGTPAALPLLQGAFRQARRASGLGSLLWDRLPNDTTWAHVINRMWRFQWTQETTPLTDDIRHLLYEESQGIIDIVVKLFMLAQLHAFQLGALRGRSERLDVGLLRHVVRTNFGLIAPMIDALKRNDREALMAFDDLKPFEIYVQQVFDSTQASLSSAPLLVNSELRTTAGAGRDEALLATLESWGLARDLAEPLIVQVRAENPNLTPLDLVAAISAKLHKGAPEVKPKKPRPPASTKPKAPPDTRDLRTIVAAGAAIGKQGYEALLAAGAIKSPLSDVA